MPTSDPTPAPDVGDAEIVRLLQQQDGRGLQLLLEKHGGRARAGLRKTFGAALNDNEIDDAMSRASFRAWRSAAAYDPLRGTLRAWFFVQLRSAGLELLRDRRRRREQLRPDLEQVVGGPDAAMADVAAGSSPGAYLAAVHACIAELPRKQRAVVEADLRAGEIADAAQLAQSLRTTRNSVYVLRSTARKALKKLLTERGCAPGAERPAEL